MAAVLAAWLLSALCACEREPVPAAEGTAGWPLGAPVDTVLAYLAETVPADVLADALDGWVGWRPEGLDDSRPLVLALLDASVLGGHAALLLPVHDMRALRRSLANCAALRGVGDDRYLLSLPPDHELMRMVRMARAAVRSRSIADLLAAMSEPSATSMAWELHEHDGYALLVPSFEAAFVVRKLLAALPLGDPAGLVISADIESLRLAWWDELDDLESQLQGLLTGSRAAGLAGLAGGLFSAAGRRPGQGGEGPSLSFARPWLWTLLTRLAPGSIAAVQLSVELDEDAGGRGVFGGADVEALLRDARLRVAYDADTPFTDLLATLEPAPLLGLDGGGLSLAADSAACVAALVAWGRPLVAEAYGDGEPTERALSELSELLSPWDGRLASVAGDTGPIVLAGARGGRRFDIEGLGAWCDRLVRGLGGADASVPASGQRFMADDVLVISTGDEDAERIEDALRALDDAQAPTEAGAPGLRLDLAGRSLGLSLQGSVIELRLAPPGRD